MNLNLETVSFEAYKAIKELDESFIGSDNYMGVAWFHNQAYRHDMRPLTPAKRKKIHDAMLKAELELCAISPKHNTIITQFI